MIGRTTWCQRGSLKAIAAIVLGALLATAIAVGAASDAYAADLTAGSLRAQSVSTNKCYTIGTANTPVYANSGLSSRIGAVYASDEVRVNSFSANKAAVNVTYPTSRGSKSGWIRTSAILSATSGHAYKSKSRFTTYRRPGGASYGAVYAGDEVVVLGRSGSWTQFRYPVSGGYKFAWAPTSTVTANTTGNSQSTNDNPSTGGNNVYSIASSMLGRKYPSFSGLGFHWRAWCADFVSYCAKRAGQSNAIPSSASVDGIRSAIKRAGGTEYSKATIQRGGYVPVRGDVIIFKSDGASHVGIVDKAANNRIYYIDGNNTTYGNGNNSCVHYSNCSYSYSKLTCVLRPKY